MKIWTLTIENDGELETSIHRTEPLAYIALDTELRAVATQYGCDPGEAPSWDEFLSDNDIPVTYSIVDHDLSGHPAIVEAKATLHVCLARLEANDIDGEERPYIEDCNTALEMLNG